MKTAWIFPGGSARAVYTAGTACALVQMNLPKPDIIIGCSGSAPTSLYYITGQIEVIKNVWCECISSGELLSLRRFWNMLNGDFLVDDLLKKEYMLNLDKMHSSSTTSYIPLTNSQTGG